MSRMQTTQDMLAQGFVPLEVVRNPIAGDYSGLMAEQRLTLDEIIASVPRLTDGFHRHGLVTLHQGEKFWVVPRHFWAKGLVTHRLRLKATAEEPVKIRLHEMPGKSGGKGVKSIISVVATIALLAVGTFITGGGLVPFLGPAFAAGSFGAQVAALAVTFVGRLAITMLAKPAVSKNEGGGDRPTLGQAGASGNLPSLGQPFYYCAGRTKVFPHWAALPLIEQVGDDELVEVPFALSGPHDIQNIKVEDTPVSQIDGLSFVVNSGLEATPQSLLSRYGYQSAPNAELKGHLRDATTLHNVKDQSNPGLCLPKPFSVTSKLDPDSLLLQLLWPAGLGETGNTGFRRQSIRITMQSTDGAVTQNLPEFTFSSNISGTRVSKSIEIIWEANPPTISDTAYDNGAHAAWHTVPNQGGPYFPAGVGGWSTHASFNGGASNFQTARVERREDRFVVYLDPAVFPRGKRWRLTISRSCMVSGAVVHPYMTGGGGLQSAFHYFSTINAPPWRVAYTYTANSVDTVMLLRFASIYKKKPIPKPGNATIEIRARNVNVSQLSCEASALIKLCNGTGFDTLGPSDNPADHVYHCLSGGLTATPIPDNEIDVPLLCAWHSENITANRKISAVFDGREWRETLNAMAAAGLARLQEGRLWGVVRSRDTYTLGVVARQAFSHLNMINFQMDKPAMPVPDAIRVSFRNRDLDWAQDERLVLRPGLTLSEANRIIGLEAAAIADEAQVEHFFELYLAMAEHRDHSFSFETWIEGMAAEEGDIIWINHLLLEETHSSARIIEVERNGSNEVTALVLDHPQRGNEESGLEVALDLVPLADMAAQGVALGCKIMTGPGVVTHPVAEIATPSNRITFTIPFVNDDVKPLQMAMLGRAGREAFRAEVTQVTPARDLRFTVTCVPEAPEAWAAIA